MHILVPCGVVNMFLLKKINKKKYFLEKFLFYADFKQKNIFFIQM